MHKLIAATSLITLVGCPGAPEEYEEELNADVTHTVTAAHTSSDWYDLRLHIIALADDSAGTNGTTTTRAQITDFTNLANQVFAPARVRFTFDPSWDWTDMVDRDLNQNLVSNNTTNWSRANTIAAKYAGKIVIFLRRNTPSNFAFPPNTGQAIPVDSPTPSPWPNFIGFMNETVGAQANRQNFAHELGHFIGLYHTHLGWANSLGTTDAAITNLQSSRGKANALDGDRISDTAQDPGPAYWTNRGWGICDVARTLTTVNGVTYTPQRSNVMGYFSCNGGTEITAGQAAAIRASLGHASRKILGHPPCNADFHNLPVAQFQTCFDYWAGRGLWPQTLTVSANAAKISGSFKAGLFRGEVRHLMTMSNYDSITNAHDANNWAPKNVNTSKNSSGSLRCTAIWEPSGGSDVVTFREMTEPSFNNQFGILYNQGYIQKDWFVRVDSSSGELRMNATWVRIPNFQGFASYYGRNWQDFKAMNKDFTADGLRVDRLVGYIQGGVTRYAATWVPTAEVSAVATSATSAEYQTNYNRLKGTFGYTLHHLSAFGADQYTSVWKAPHGLCTAGSKLAPESEACVTQVCDLDPFCCSDSWDSLCVSQVGSVCGRPCP